MAIAERNAEKVIFGSLEDGVVEKSMVTNNNVSPLIVILPLVVLFVTLFNMLISKGFPRVQVPEKNLV